jgi:acyl-CoA dehydrogenase
VQGRLKDAVKRGELQKAPAERLLAEALGKGLVSAAEAQTLRDAETLRRAAVEVDSFSLEEYLATAGKVAQHV